MSRCCLSDCIPCHSPPFQHREEVKAIGSAQIKKSDWDLVFGDESNTALYDALNRDGSVKTGLFGTGVLNVGFMKEEEKLADLFELERGFDFGGWDNCPSPNATVTRTMNKVVNGESELNYSIIYELVE